MDTWRAGFRGLGACGFRPNVFDLTMLAPSRKAISGHPRVRPLSLRLGRSRGSIGPRIRRRRAKRCPSLGHARRGKTTVSFRPLRVGPQHARLVVLSWLGDGFTSLSDRGKNKLPNSAAARAPCDVSGLRHTPCACYGTREVVCRPILTASRWGARDGQPADPARACTLAACIAPQVG